MQKQFLNQGVGLSVNNFWSFFWIWNEILPKDGDLIKTFLSAAFSIITSDEYNLLRNYLIHELMKFGG